MTARKGEQRPAATLPVARVLVDVPLAHLDRPFDYLVPEQLDEVAVPGCRVRVRFAGQQVDGFLAERVGESEFGGRLGFLTKVVSPEPVLAPEIAALARAVADRYAGTMIDILRLAIPPRHAKVEAEPPPDASPPPAAPPVDAWRRYPRGPAFLEAVRAGRQAHAVWQALPGEDWPARLAELAVTAAAGDRGAVLVVPDYRDVARLHAACVALAGEDAVVALSADAGPAKRYRRWLSVLRGGARIVVGTRASVFAPVHRPGVFVVWDDGDDLHADPHAPYPHVRDVLIQRAHAAGASVVVAGFARTAEAQLLVESGWAPEIVASREELRAAAPRIVALGETDFQLARDPAARAARIPSVAFDAARAALADGRPVLVQVPRGGYVPALACQQCRTPARCRRCAGPLGLPTGERLNVARPAARRGGGGRTSRLPDASPSAAGPAEPGGLFDSPADGSDGAGPIGGHGGAGGSGAGRGGSSDRRGSGEAGRPGEPDGLFDVGGSAGGAGRSDADGPGAGAVGRVDAANGRGGNAGGSVPRRSGGAPEVARSGGGAPAGVGRGDTPAASRAGWPDGSDDSVGGAARSGAGGPGAGAVGRGDMANGRGGNASGSVPGRSAGVAGWGGGAAGGGESGGAARFGESAAGRGAAASGRGGDTGRSAPVGGGESGGDRAVHRTDAAEGGGPADARSPTCRWCGVPDTAFRCGACGSRRLRAIVVGAKRTAEELGRAFADVPVLGSGASEVLAEVEDRAALVVATPGAEPVARGGYGAALLLDGWALLGRADLRATEEALRRWMAAAAMVRPASAGGRVVVLAESALVPVQALVRWDPVWHARQELAGRTELGFPPAVRMASVDGSADALATFLDELDLPPTGEILGPVPLGDKERALVRASRADGRALAAALTTAQHVRTARKEPDPIRVRLDPLELI
jgi:primosomal protein N'